MWKVIALDCAWKIGWSESRLAQKGRGPERVSGRGQEARAREGAPAIGDCRSPKWSKIVSQLHRTVFIDSGHDDEFRSSSIVMRQCSHSPGWPAFARNAAFSEPEDRLAKFMRHAMRQLVLSQMVRFSGHSHERMPVDSNLNDDSGRHVPDQSSIFQVPARILSNVLTASRARP